MAWGIRLPSPKWSQDTQPLDRTTHICMDSVELAPQRRRVSRTTITRADELITRPLTRRLVQGSLDAHQSGSRRFVYSLIKHQTKQTREHTQEPTRFPTTNIASFPGYIVTRKQKLPSLHAPSHHFLSVKKKNPIIPQIPKLRRKLANPKPRDHQSFTRRALKIATSS